MSPKTLLLFRAITPPHPPGGGTYMDTLIASWGLGEAAGIRADRFGTNHLASVNNVGSGAGIINDAAEYDAGLSQTLYIDTNLNLEAGNTDLTFALWAYLTDKTSNRAFIAKVESSANREYEICYESFTNRFRFKVTNNAGTWAKYIDADALGSPALNTWYFIVAWHDRIKDTVNIQVNNGTVNSSSWTGNVRVSNSPFCIGSYSTVGDFMDGKVDEVYMWKRILTPVEKTFIYNAGGGQDWLTIETKEYINEMKAHMGWNLKTLFNKTGHSIVRHMYDVDADGKYELVCNVGQQAHFAALKADETIVWQNVVNTTKEKGAYYPKIAAGKVFYGGQVSGKIWAINLTDGSLAWTVTKAGLSCLDICDKGLVYGASTNVGILEFATGNNVAGWPVNVGMTVHEQILISGDLDSDGLDEIVCNDNNGHIKAIDHDGTILWTYTGNHNHPDSMFIANIDSGNPGMELVALGRTSGSGETTSVMTFDKDGNQLHITYVGATTEGVEMRVGNIGVNGKVAYCAEGIGVVGVMDGQLNKIWEVSGLSADTSQIEIGDVNGDGDLEVMTNVSEIGSSNMLVYSCNGDLLATVHAMGWDFDPHMDVSSGKPDPAHDYDGDGKAEILPGLLTSSDTSSNNIIRLLGTLDVP
jgi:hypothetical protein